ncbi:uncharacterized protein LOC112575976 [Pomacea canaliculata]|uniref:uncharacterized protein LOC112575976 n=1 Tax=Pomacea canaliculata TaxID=400727 RepID=UPI000D72AEF0|nr:uncharacterized protein LOC112575976 [Pomacea canaliculata]
MGIKWLLDGHPVYIVSTWLGSRAACIMMYHLLLQTVNTQQSAGVSRGQLQLLQYELDGKDVEKAVNELSQVASGGSLYVIADEVIERSHVKIFCDKLLTRVPHLHLWAASCLHGDAPTGWQVEYLTRPLRSPPAVVREVEQSDMIYPQFVVKSYSERGVTDHTDGPPVRLLSHRKQGHSDGQPGDCVTCGREVASFLHSLRVGVTENVTTASTTVPFTTGGTPPSCLQWRDVLVLHWGGFSENSGMMNTLIEAGIPVRVMKDDDVEDVATARSDVVWVTDGDSVRGLERKVVVCLDGAYDSVRLQLYCLSRCTAQLMYILSTTRVVLTD